MEIPHLLQMYLRVGAAMLPPLLYIWFFRRRFARGVFASIRVEEGPVLWVVDGISRASDSGYYPSLALPRLRLLEPGRFWKLVFVGRSGARLLILGDSLGRRWFASQRLGLHARDGSSGELVLDGKMIEAAVPELRGSLLGERRVDEVYRAVPGGAQVLARDGRRWRFDFATMRAVAASEIPANEESPTGWATGRLIESKCALADGRIIELRGEPRRGLFIDNGRIGRGDWLTGGVVQDPANGNALELPGAAILVVHRETVEDKSPLLVSRVSLETGIATWTCSNLDWKIKAPRGRRCALMAAALRGGRLFLVVNPWSYSVLELELESGNLLWKKRG